MANHAAWRTVDVGQGDTVKLLGKATYDRNGYQVHLTDLSRIWGEQLTKDEIFQRAEAQRCSIDPSEDDHQYDILLGKLKGALNHADGTTLSLHDDSNGHALTADVTARLPGSLAPLRWTLNLRQLPETHVERELVTPLLKQARGLKHQIQQLIDELRHKDHVISKITDRLETSGNDLLACFPSVSNVKISRKNSQRGQLAQHVKGLAEFEPDVWKAQVAHRDGVQLDWRTLDEIFRDLPAVPTKPPETGSGNRWWLSLGHPGQEAIARKRGRGSSSPDDGAREDSWLATGRPVSTHEESMQEDEFERQQTPLHLRYHSPGPQYSNVTVQSTEHSRDTKGSSSQADDESTADEDDHLDAPPPKADSRRRSPGAQEPTRSATPAQQDAPRKLGTIGGARVSASPAKQTPTRSELPEPVKPKSKLGKIGGKAATKPTPEPTPPAGPPSLPVPSSAMPVRKPKMGVIGGKKAKGIKAEAPPSAQAESSVTPKPTRESSPRRPRQVEKAPSPTPSETSQERADKKRDQLKQELEEKAKAPVKKKRKF